MAEFSTTALLEIDVDEQSLRSARSTIEDRVGSVRSGVATDGGQSQPAFDANRMSRENALSRQLLTAQVEKLGDIEDVLEKQGVQEAQQGGGEGGGLLTSGLALRGLTSILGGGGGAGGLLSMFTGGPLPGVSGGVSAMLSGQFGRGGVTQPGDEVGIGSDPVGRTLLNALGQDPGQFTMTTPGARPQDRGPGARALADIGRGEFEFKNPMQDWELPQSLTTVNLQWDNPVDDWQLPGWLQQAIDLFSNQGSDGPTQPRRTGNRSPRDTAFTRGGPTGSGGDINVPGIDVSLSQDVSFDDLQEVRREIDSKFDEAVDEAVRQIEQQFNELGGGLL